VAMTQLNVKVKQSARELRREGEMVRGGRGWSNPFYRGWGMSGRRLLGR
jgi:hypothetical protein